MQLNAWSENDEFFSKLSNDENYQEYLYQNDENDDAFYAAVVGALFFFFFFSRESSLGELSLSLSSLPSLRELLTPSPLETLFILQS